ncbi:hypothetical protein A2U01_0096724, partial [Trifolium medium]|nr:hypothetical protein [Trifolium medium]
AALQDGLGTPTLFSPTDGCHIGLPSTDSDSLLLPAVPPAD